MFVDSTATFTPVSKILATHTKTIDCLQTYCPFIFANTSLPVQPISIPVICFCLQYLCQTLCLLTGIYFDSEEIIPNAVGHYRFDAGDEKV